MWIQLNENTKRFPRDGTARADGVKLCSEGLRPEENLTGGYWPGEEVDEKGFAA